MNIYFDHQIFTQQEFGGISRYFFELVKGLNKIDGVTTACPMVFSNNEYIENSVYFPHAPFLRSKKIKGKIRVMDYINTVYSKRRLATSEYDIFHPTYYSTYYMRNSIKSPIVITCLDMIHEKFIQEDKQTIDNKRITLERADVILAISNSTKRDLEEMYGLPPQKIRVTHLAASLTVPDDESSTYSGSPFLLYVGMRNLYKNFKLFLEAVSPLLNSSDLILVCAGGGVFTDEELELFNRLKVSGRVKFERASDDNLSKLYSSAIAFFYPSKYEGFGIPVLEAMSCNCPVVCSNTSSLPEVGGDAALYFDPNDIESIRDAAVRVIGSRDIRNSLQIKGKERVKLFTWDGTVKQTFNVYNSLK